MHNLRRGKWNFLLANTYFGEVSEADSYIVNGQEIFDVYAGKLITDISISYSFSQQLRLTVGSDNLFDIYPDERAFPITDGNQFIYSRRIAQFGSNGRYVFARLNFITLKAKVTTSFDSCPGIYLN